ncbi:hypothetical protein Hanom_Chr10g00894081 [Helianthus anomalus]
MERKKKRKYIISYYTIVSIIPCNFYFNTQAKTLPYPCTIQEILMNGCGLPNSIFTSN